VMTVVSREDFRTILEKHMNRNETEMAAFETLAKQGDDDLAQKHSKAKTCLDIICSGSRVSSTMTADSIVNQLLSGNTTTVITETDYSALYDAANDLDVLFVQHDSQWDAFVQTQRDTLLHRPKRRKRD